MSRYNLIDEKWIPVRFPDGSRDELGIRETLLRSREIAEIEDPSPLVAAALHRFLLAVLYRALEGPTDIEEAKRLFRDGIPAIKITEYLEKWRERFWLYDERFPFGQIPKLELKSRAWTVLAAEHNADNAKVLFDHVNVGAPGKICEAMASRWLLATQTFSVSCGKSELSHTGTAPSATAAMILPIGANLHDTLVLSLVPENREIIALDYALWEKEPESINELRTGIERAPRGIADRYTWRTRSILLQSDESGQIEKLGFASGVGVSSTDDMDPMVGYKVHEKLGKLPMRFRERGIWRDFDSLMPGDPESTPIVIEHAAALSRSVPAQVPRSVMVLGQVNSKAKIDYWRMERFSLPAAFATDRSIRTEIGNLLSLASDAEHAIEEALRKSARMIITKGSRELQEDKWKAGKWTPGDVSKYIGKTSSESIPHVLANYWSSLEPNFHELLHEYTTESTSDQIRCRWLKNIRTALVSAWELHRSSVPTSDAWTIRALVNAEGSIARKREQLTEEIQTLEKDVAKP